MQAIKLVIPGEYWDSQLYSGNLYLFGDAGELTVVDWDIAINNNFLFYDKSLKMAGHTAFLESNLLYEKGVQFMLQDPLIKNTLLEKFKSLARMELQLDLRNINSSYILKIDNPLPFPHVDSEIYYRRLYVSLKEGVFYSKCNGKNVKDKSTKVWDTPTFDITASKSYTTIAFAAGSEGLFQQKIESDTRNKEQKQPTLISNNHCTTCKWSDFNIYATSHIDKSFFASFKKVQDKDNKRKYIRKFERVISAAEIFNDEGFSWGIQDKLYVYRNQGIDAIKYSSQKNGFPSFERIGRIELDSWKGEVVSAEVTPFGTVIECENAIIIIQSDNKIFTIPGEPVNWRVFSKSHNYTNQLHIIYEDRLEIFSFYNDYFIEQADKISGITVSIS
jgi:hypothetical protein